MAQKTFASVKVIQEQLKLSFGQAAVLRQIVKGPQHYCGDDGIPLAQFFPKTRDWILHCYSMPRMSEIQETMINELLGTHGVEAIRKEGSWVSFYGDIVYTYCNQGDPYIPTVMFDCRTQEFFIACWGDVVERENL